MRIVYSKWRVPIRITDERIRHILDSHPEMRGEENRILETVEYPDQILEGDFGELLAIRHYSKTPVSENKYLIVAFKEVNKVDGFLITAYFSTRLPKRRTVLWKP